MTGFRPGLASGGLVGVFCWALLPSPVYLLMALAAGAAGGLFSNRAKDYAARVRVGFLAGASAGLIHAALVYLPMKPALPWMWILGSIVFIALMEGIAVSVFFIIVRGILREENRREMERELLKTKLLFLQAQINPHFLYNVLNTISAVCGREGAAQAQHLVLRLADFFRSTLRKAEDAVTLKEEMECIDAYLEIEQARFQDRLKIEKEYAMNEALWGLRIPILILQPLVENAVKHGIAKNEAGGTVRIRFHELDGHLRIEVENEDAAGEAGQDQGPERKVWEGAKQGMGIGLANIRERLQSFFGRNCSLQFEALLQKGTRVSLEIPIPASFKKQVMG